MLKDSNRQIYGILKSQNAVFNITKPRTSIGRSKTSTIVLNHPSISKDHAVLELDEDTITIKDLNSSNGTFVNGQRLQSSPVLLKTSDRISFGKDPIEYTFESFSQDNEKTIMYPHDGKISLVNETSYQGPRINHFKNSSPNFMMDSAKFNNFDFVENENDVTFKNKSEEFSKQIQVLSSEKEELIKKVTSLEENINKKANDNKKLNDLFDQLNEEFGKLNAKHNSLMVYASDLQKKVDSLEVEVKEKNSQMDINKLLSEKDNLITNLQNEINYYKSTSSFPSKLPNGGTGSEVSMINKRLDDLIEDYIKENRKLKNKNEKLEKEIKLMKKNFIEHTQNDVLNTEYENQLNIQIDNFNNIIADYNTKYCDAVGKIPLLFEKDKKEEAAKFLVDQVNVFMKENQRLIDENAKIKSEKIVLENKLATQKKMNDIKNDHFSDEHIIENEEVAHLKSKIEVLENIITKLKI